ncbi:MAG: single-stranded DNA-binding protein [Ignavibacteriae bacterium]|nr:single-stranded DNA-binding protein [Ignavibacteriota bacterium]
MAGRSLNKVILIGNLGKDPELSYIPSGVAVAKFSIATNERWKDQDGNLQERTEWHNIVAWRKLAEICGQYLKKGSKIYVEGKLQTRSWDDKNTGVKRYTTEIVANDLIMLDAKGVGVAEVEQPMTEEPQETEKEDLPF